MRTSDAEGLICPFMSGFERRLCITNRCMAWRTTSYIGKEKPDHPTQSITRVEPIEGECLRLVVKDGE